jgi:hypothetical protein
VRCAIGRGPILPGFQDEEIYGATALHLMGEAFPGSENEEIYGVRRLHLTEELGDGSAIRFAICEEPAVRFLWTANEWVYGAAGLHRTEGHHLRRSGIGDDLTPVQRWHEVIDDGRDLLLT